MGFEPTHAERFGFAVQCINQSATLSYQRSFKGKLSRTKKKTWSKDASLQLKYNFFCSKQKNLSNQAIVRPKIGLTCIWIVPTNLAL